MTSIFLEGLADEAEARVVLSRLLPHWIEPWLLKDAAADTVAIFTVIRVSEGTVSIQADAFGLQDRAPEMAIDVLRTLQAELGGTITDGDENVL